MSRRQAIQRYCTYYVRNIVSILIYMLCRKLELNGFGGRLTAPDESAQRVNVWSLFRLRRRLASCICMFICITSKTVEAVVDRRGALDASRNLQSSTAPVAAPTESFLGVRINAGAGEAYTDSAGIAWIADKWYGGKGRRLTPSDCTSDIANTTDEIIYCSQRYFPPAQAKPPYEYNIPVPYTSQYEIRLHFAEIVSMKFSIAATPTVSLFAFRFFLCY
jgi:hypothetical protein